METSHNTTETSHNKIKLAQHKGNKLQHSAIITTERKQAAT